MAGVAEVRADLAQALRLAGATVLEVQGVDVFDHVPEVVDLPAYLVAPADPYITEGDTFDRAQMVAHLEVYAIAGAADNATATDQLDALIEAALLATDWLVDGVGRPYLAPVNGHRHLTARIRLSTTYRLTEGNTP